MFNNFSLNLMAVTLQRCVFGKQRWSAGILPASCGQDAHAPKVYCSCFFVPFVDKKDY
jgi:hypothetical protein